MLINPQSEFLREPNLLIPGRKPVGSVKLRQPGGFFVEQWLGDDFMLPKFGISKLVSSNAERDRGGIRFSPVGTTAADHYTLYAALQRSITTRPYGFIGVGISGGASGDYGATYAHFGILKNATGGATRSYCFGEAFRGRPYDIQQKTAFGTTLQLATDNHTSNSLAVGDRFCCGFASFADNAHTTYGQVNNGAIDTGSSTVDMSGDGFEFNSISLGASRSYDNATTIKCFPFLAETMIVLHGHGLTDAVMRDVINDPYQFLIPA